MKRAALALVLVACSSSANDFPSHPGGGPGVSTGGGGGIVDAGIGDAIGDASDAGIPIAGRVCLVQDLRAPISGCDALRAGGLTVTLGTTFVSDAGTRTVVGKATTAVDGRFTMVAPIGPGFIWHVTGDGLTTSVMEYGTLNTIPAMLSEVYLALRESNNMLMGDDQHGDVMMRLVRGVAPVAGIVATVTPLADAEVRYDSKDSAIDWNQTATQTQGMVWVPNAQLGTAHVVLGAADGTGVKTPADTTVESQSITFVTQVLP